MKTPRVEDVLNAMRPLEWATLRLVYPEGFSSFQATNYHLPLLMESKVLVKGVFGESIFD